MARCSAGTAFSHIFLFNCFLFNILKTVRPHRGKLIQGDHRKKSVATLSQGTQDPLGPIFKPFGQQHSSGNRLKNSNNNNHITQKL